MNPLAMITQLHDAGVQYIVIGGIAGLLQGSARLTNDLDILYEPSRENATALARLLVAWEAYPRDVPAGLPFVPDERTLRGCESLTLQTIYGGLDVFRSIPGFPSYAAALEMTEEVTVDGVPTRVLTLEGLIRAKAACDRPKDREHLIELRALQDIVVQQRDLVRSTERSLQRPAPKHGA